MLMVISTVLERNPEINYSSVLKLDEVCLDQNCVSEYVECVFVYGCSCWRSPCICTLWTR